MREIHLDSSLAVWLANHPIYTLGVWKGRDSLAAVTISLYLHMIKLVPFV